ncbi:MAG: hypothetical protein H6Q33_2892 [Deltaproteobacteria bacterium]|nr:hypothetical protein [Deltaproteobacteria bacterium]
MRGPAVLSIVAVLAVLAVEARGAQPCTNQANCAQVTVGSAAGAPGGTAVVPVSFRQGAGGGIEEIAAIAFTLTMPSGTPPPLTLADCTPSASDTSLPKAAQPDPAISNFKLVIENAYCTASRTHCLCPGSGSGINPDNFINVVIYGPNPLPTPGPSPVVIPTLPLNGPVFTLALAVNASTPAGPINLHVLNQVDDTAASKPPFTALLSVGDKNAVDQTCGAATPPCSDPNGLSQVVVNDGTVTVSGARCIDDCDGDGEVFGNEITKAINILLGNADLTTCAAADANGDGEVFGNEITLGLINLSNGCPAQ